MPSTVKYRARPSRIGAAPLQSKGRGYGRLSITGGTGGIDLNEYAVATLQAAGYTVIAPGTDWSEYPDTASALAGFGFGSSSGSNVPRGAYITKVNDDPIFPDRMIESLMPYNNDGVGLTGSAGRQFLKNFTPPANTPRIWVRYVSRHGGTLHPTRPQPLDYSHDGDFPASSADSVKLFFFEWNGGIYSGGRIGIQYANTTTLAVDVGFGGGAGAPVTTNTVFTEAGAPDWTGALLTETAQFTGLDVYEYTHEYYRVSDDLAIYRRLRQQLTVGGSYNPQAPAFRGVACARTGGGVLPYVNLVRLHDNKNNTTKSDGLSSLDWDAVFPATVGAFASTNADSGILRAESDKPFRGARRYYGPILPVYGGDGRPFTDHLGKNLDDYGRLHANFPPGVP